MEHGASSHASGIVAFSVEETRLRACLVDRVEADSRLVGWINVQRSRKAPVADQLAAVLHRLGARLGRSLWNRARQEPFTSSRDPIGEPPLAHVTGGAAAASPLRVWLAGLSANLSIAAARRALGSAPVEIVGVTAYANDSAAALEPDALLRTLTELRPDVLLLVGGYDTGERRAEQTITALARCLLAPLQRLPPAQIPHILYAGNRLASEEVGAAFRDLGDEVRVEIVANLQPAPGIDNRTDLCRALHAHHWRLLQRGAGMARVAHWVTEPARLTSLDQSFIQLVGAWRRFHLQRELHAAYRSETWRLHVWSHADHTGVHLAYRPADASEIAIPGWPPLTLYSGAFPDDASLPTSLRLWDQSGMAPLIGTIGQVDPAAMIQTLQLDLFSTLRASAE